MADEKIIFSMVGVSKTLVNNRKILNDIYLSFFYGAKIGIIGLNGSGKSTLMKIIAGIDKNFQGMDEQVLDEQEETEETKENIESAEDN